MKKIDDSLTVCTLAGVSVIGSNLMSSRLICAISNAELYEILFEEIVIVKGNR